MTDFTCAHCGKGVRWSNRLLAWVHENGRRSCRRIAPSTGLPYVATPGGRP